MLNLLKILVKKLKISKTFLLSISDLEIKFFSIIPKDFGIDGPNISASSIPALLFNLDVPEASKEVTNDLPTPPLPLTIPILLFTLLNSFTFSLKSLLLQSLLQDEQS